MEKRQMFAIRKYDAIIGYTDDELLAKAIATRICDSEANYHAAYVCKRAIVHILNSSRLRSMGNLDQQDECLEQTHSRRANSAGFEGGTGIQMIKIENAKVYDLVESIRASKFPMAVDTEDLNGLLTNTVMKLATSPKGEGHDNFLNGIRVAFDLTFTIKAWTEMERYHFIDFVSSQSTMHRITKFDLDKSYCEYVDPRMVGLMKDLVDEYNDDPTPENYLRVLYSNPCGFQLTARMTTNYRQLKTIYSQRKDHRLPEWKEFCKWIETLPHSELITGPR